MLKASCFVCINQLIIVICAWHSLCPLFHRLFVYGATDINVDHIYCEIWQNWDLKNQRQYKGRLFQSSYLYDLPEFRHCFIYTCIFLVFLWESLIMFDFHQGRECFACAPTGSGKTFAFVFPVLMKLKVHIYWHCYVCSSSFLL